MEILVELAPPRRRSELESFLSCTREYVDCYDIPESPLGYPSPNAIATSIYVKEVTGKCVIPHIRLYDVNTNGLLSLAYAAYLYGVDGIVLTRGDKPKYGSIVEDVDTEKAITFLKKKIPDLRIGAIISLRYPLSEIKKRISIGADFFLVLRLGRETIEKYVEVNDIARENDVELYPYIIVSTSKNKNLLNKIDHPVLSLSEVDAFINRYKHLFKGILVSCPVDLDGLLKTLKIINRSRAVSRKSLQQQQYSQASL